MRRGVALALAIVVSASASAAPTVFISEGRGEAWWNASSAKGRVTGRVAGGVTVAGLTKHIEETETYHTYKICALTEVQNDTYVGVDPSTQDSISATLPSVRWRVQARTPDGRRVVAQSVLYEDCDDADNRGAAVLVTDVKTSDILLFRPMGPGERNGASVPIWTAFLNRPEGKGPDVPLFSFSSCTECGAETAVYYDVTRKKMYTEYNGH